MKRLAALIVLFLVSCLHADNLGNNLKIGGYVGIPCRTHQIGAGRADATSITYRIYKDGAASEIVADTAMTKFDGVDGFYLDHVQLTSAAGFEADKNYTVLIQATVDGVTDNLYHTFRIISGETTIGFDLSTPADIGNVFSNLVTVGTGTNQIALSGGAVTVGTNNDKTGYELSLAQAFNNTGTWTGDLTGAVGSVTAPTTLTPAYDAAKTAAAAGAAMTLTGAYDAAKTAATQTSVDTIDTNVDTLLSTGVDVSLDSLIQVWMFDWNDPNLTSGMIGYELMHPATGYAP